MAAQKDCPTVLLSDNPAQADEFNGSHQRIADAIAEMIRTEPGGRTIGLEGEWGSGKSTVIELLRGKLGVNKGPDTDLLFLFDAWAHASDPLRRTFLEQLLAALRKAKWISDEQWEKKWKGECEELAGVKTFTTTENTPRITHLGVVVIVLGFFIPIGLALVSNALRNGLNFKLFRWLPGQYRVSSWPGLFSVTHYCSWTCLFTKVVCE